MAFKAKALAPCDMLVEEDYIDMDVTSATFLCYTISSSSSPPRTREFEFHMSSHPPQREPTASPSPADELFYKGKLLPLQLPPRMQMVQKLEGSDASEEEEKKTVGAAPAAADNTDTNTTPFESCDVSPAGSSHVSGELSCPPAGELSAKKPRSKKLRSSLGTKLKASRAYLRSLFTKSGCSDESCAVPNAGGKNPVGQQLEALAPAPAPAPARKRTVKEELGHRRSFSGVIKWNVSAAKSSSASSTCSSSSSSSSASSSASSNGFSQTQKLKRSSSVNSELESSIQGAIAYCKKSQQLISARKSVSDVGFYSLSTRRSAADCETQERLELCRG